jgi:chromosome partitioning protein
MTLVHVVANQKGGVGKTTLSLQLAAVAHQALSDEPPLYKKTAEARPIYDPNSGVLVASTDPQQSAIWWAKQAEESGGLPFHYVQVDDPRELVELRRIPQYQHVFVDTPGSLRDEDVLQAALNECDDVLVPMIPEALCFDATMRTVNEVIQPRGIPYRVVINLWDPRDGVKDLTETAEFIRLMGWPVCNTIVRRYKAHTLAAARGEVVTQYERSRATTEARADLLELAMELGYGAIPRQRAVGRAPVEVSH